MTKIARYIECALGILFLLSAGMKAMNVDGFGVSISAYGLIKDPSLVRTAAYISLALETLIGTAFVAGWRGKNLSFTISILLTAVFSALITYAWKVNGLEDCGCFGDYIKMNPPQSLAKNAVIIGLALVACFGLRNAKDAEFRPKFKIQGLAILGAFIVLLITLFANASSTTTILSPTASDKDIAFVFGTGNHMTDLGTGDYLVAFLNTECDHCKDSVPGLNALAQDESLPTFIAFMMGNDETLDDFIIETKAEFPTELMDDLTFMQYIKVAPPIVYHSRDGMFTHDWQWEEDPPSPSIIAQDILKQKD